MIVFDIETGPLPGEKLLAMMPPFTETVAEFDPAKVKVGNLKDEAKIAEKIEAARATHEAILASVEDRKAAHALEFIERAALSPLTGQVLAIGYKSEGRVFVDGQHGEADTIKCFWHQVVEAAKDGTSLIGFNSHGFDLPFLTRRSWLLGVDVPANIFQRTGYWNAVFIDLLAVWRCGNRSEYVKLDELARSLGLAGKPDGITGADFARLWNGSDDEREQAVDYLTNDLEMTYRVAEAMQVV